MAYSHVFDMPMKLGLELMAIIGSNGMHTERENLLDIIDEFNGSPLIVLGVDFHCPDPCCIINGRILEPFDSVVIFVDKRQKLNINLNMMTRNLFLVSFRTEGSSRRLPRKPIQSVPFQDTIYADRRYSNVWTISLQIHMNPFGLKVIRFFK